MNGQDRSQVIQAIHKKIIYAQLGLMGFISLTIILGFIVDDQLWSFLYCLFLGGLGGSISYLRRLPTEEYETLARSNESTVTTLMPIVYGSIMAIVMYLLFMSGILTGDGGKGLFTSNLFPNFGLLTGEGKIECSSSTSGSVLDQMPATTIKEVLSIRPCSVKDLGKLFVWCFISGYSEKFVAGILGSLEKRGGIDKD